jgi:hypothetical protein
MDVVRQTKLLGQGDQLLPQEPLADHEKVDLRARGADASGGSQERRYPLLGFEPGNDTDQRALLPFARDL